MGKFLDLSDYQTIVDYSSIKENYEGAIVKATQGVNFICNSFYEKVQALKNLGVKVGAYHFLDMTGSPEKQAEHFWNTVKDYEFELAYVLDVETDGGTFDGNPSLHIEAFINKFNVLSNGKNIIVYTGWYYCHDNITLETRKNHKWWIASYGVPQLNAIEGCDIVAWQYTSSEQVAGIVGGVDSSIIFNDGVYMNNYDVVTTKPPEQQTTVNPKNPVIVWDYEYDSKIVELQEILNNHGSNLSIDGIAGDLTYAECKKYTIELNDKGTLTKWVQERLNNMGFNAGYVDGVAEQPTLDGISRFQEHYGLGIGYLGGTDWYYLIK